jgi:RNA polymerase sigma-70 factor (ECF subfamily)
VSSAQAEQQPLDSGLVARMAEGDVVALAVLYERHSRAVYAVARSVLRSSQEAEDLTHDVFLEAWRRSDEYSEERGSVRAWLYMRTRSRALDRLKAAGHSLRAAVEPSPRATPTSLVERYRLRERLSKMPDILQQVLILGYFEGMTTSEIAERLGVPVGTVKSRTRLALEALRKRFGAGL